MQRFGFIIFTFVISSILQLSIFAQSSSVNLCQSQVQAKQFEAALVSCTEAIKTNATIGTLGRALAYAGKMNWEEAIKDFNAVISLNPQMASAYMYRGGAYQQKGEYKNAVNDYERASTLDARLSVPLRPQITQAKELYELSSPKTISKENIRASLEHNLKANDLMILRSVNALNKKSQVEIEANDKAIFDKIALALQINPYNGLAYKLRGDFNKTLNKNELALIDYTKAIVVEPKNISFYKARAELYAEFKSYEFALADYAKMIELEPKKYDGYFDRARFYDKLGKDDLALTDFAKVIELEPKNTLGYSSRANFYWSRNKYDSALPDIKQIIILQPNDASGRLLSCRYYNKKGDYNAAIKDCTIAVNQKSFIFSDLALIERSDSYIALKKFDLALADLATASASEYSSKEDIGIRRGKIYLAQGKKTEALAEFNAALKENPKNEQAKKEVDALQRVVSQNTKTEPTTPVTINSNLQKLVGEWEGEIRSESGQVRKVSYKLRIGKNNTIEQVAVISGREIVVPNFKINNFDISFMDEFAITRYKGKLSADFTLINGTTYDDGEGESAGNWFLKKKSANPTTNIPPTDSAKNAPLQKPQTPVNPPTEISNIKFASAPEPFESQFQKGLKEAVNQPNPSSYRGQILLNFYTALAASGKPETEVVQLTANKALEIAYIDFYAYYQNILMNKNLNVKVILKINEIMPADMKNEVRRLSQMTVTASVEKKPLPNIAEIHKPGFGWKKTVSSNVP